MTEKVPFRFKWVSASPDPKSAAMRNNLEPQEIYVEIGLPLKHEYFANAEDLLKEGLGVDIGEPVKPILSPEGMRYALEQLSLQEVLEPVDEAEWDEAEPAEETPDAEWDADETEDEDFDDLDWDE